MAALTPSGMCQMALPFAMQPSYRAEDFLIAASNAGARRWLDRTEDWPDRRLVLWGDSGCGKSHLARLWAGPCPVLDGPSLTGFRTDIDTARLVVDAADLCVDETALLHLLNSSAEAGRYVLLTARLPPGQWPPRLADLASRLRASPAIGIEPPEDELLRALFIRLIAERQWAVPPKVQDWLLLHLPRSAWAIQVAIARLDGLSLARGQAVTKALARSGLADLLGAAADDDNSMIAAAGFANDASSI